MRGFRDLIASISIFLLFTAVGSASELDQAQADPVPCSSDRLVRYFPEGTFREKDRHWDSDAFLRGWYSRHLNAMNETSLSCGPRTSDESYRFLWLRSFHAPIAVRIERTGEKYTLIGKILDGLGGYDPGRIERRIRKHLTAEQWRRAIIALDQLDFWKMPTTQHDIVGTDGAEWIIEGRKDAYHVVDRGAVTTECGKWGWCFWI